LHIFDQGSTVLAAPTPAGTATLPSGTLGARAYFLRVPHGQWAKQLAILKIKRFQGDDPSRLEQEIRFWLAKQPGTFVVERSERRSGIRHRTVLLSVWCEKS
jgi:hypothetical protein